MAKTDSGSTAGEISTKTRVTVAFVFVCMPFIVWAVRTDSTVQRLDEQNRELRADLKEISRKLEDIRDRLPPRDRSISNPRPLHNGAPTS